MAFFNYSTMQMTAKIVYYGPGLGGKTTNLQHVYQTTSEESRGEMVSLETEADRTLFFDLLPMEVGVVSGFKTRLQLYTVPGQVFYNTTRKLVLKAVDGVVFVADSQRAMMDANMFSFSNLQENLAELNLTIDSVPLVLQYNKRDLPNVCTIEEMNAALNPTGKPYFESVATTGEGIFETLRGISRLTLDALKAQLNVQDEDEDEEPETTAATTTAAPAVSAPPVAAAPAPPVASPPSAMAAPPAPAPSAPAPAAPAVPTPAAPPLPASPTATAPPAATAAAAPVATAAAQPQPNGRHELNRQLRIALGSQIGRARRVSLHLQIEDENDQIVRVLPNLKVDIDQSPTPNEVLLRLHVELSGDD